MWSRRGWRRNIRLWIDVSLYKVFFGVERWRLCRRIRCAFFPIQILDSLHRKSYKNQCNNTHINSKQAPGILLVDDIYIIILILILTILITIILILILITIIILIKL
jgi:hypothetical protein